MAVVRGFVVFLKYDISGFGGLRKALLRWRYRKILEPQNQFYFRGTLSKPPSLSEGSFCHILSTTITISATNIIKRSQIHVNRTKSFTDRFDDTCISPTAKMLPPVRLYNQVKIKLNAKVLPLRNSQYIEVKEPISARQ